MTAPSSTAQRQVQIKRETHQIQSFTQDLGNGVAMRFVLIPAGTFMMGSTGDELGQRENEKPQHEVTIPRCWMGQYPVTQAQWREVTNYPKVNQDLKSAPSHFKGDDLLVEQVSWYDAEEFCQRLSQKNGYHYRLPTEAEWEYACRAGTTTPFHFGMSITTGLANYRGTDWEEYNLSGSYGEGPKGEYREKTTPVDHFKVVNAFGLADMHGNVWEWCQDHRHENYEGAPTDGSAWLTENETQDRILRGGSWDFNPEDCRSAYRIYYSPVFGSSSIGFRLICVPR